MKERIIENWRTLAATLFSVALLASVYVIVRGIESPSTVSASTESALLQAIATKDSDGDGLSDWEEALYGTDPRVIDTSNLGMTDGEAVSRGLIVPLSVADIPTTDTSPSSLDSDGLPPAPKEGTLTDTFAKTFFALFVKAKKANGGADLSESEMQSVADEALSSISAFMDVAPDFKSAKDLVVAGSGPEALKEFAIKAEAVLMKNMSTATTSEIHYLKRAVENNDTAALSHVASISKVYRDSAIGLSVLRVPTEIAGENLALVNAMMRMSQIASDFAKVNDDPLVTILALKQYPQAVLNLGNAFIHIGEIYKTAGISLPSGSPGASFVNLILDIAASQQVTKKP